MKEQPNYTTLLIIGAAFVICYCSRTPQTVTQSDTKQRDSIYELNQRHLDTISYLRDSINLLHYKDSVIQHRIYERNEQTEAKVDSINLWNDTDVLQWLCERYGLCDTTQSNH